MLFLSKVIMSFLEGATTGEVATIDADQSTNTQVAATDEVRLSLSHINARLYATTYTWMLYSADNCGKQVS